MTAPDLLAGRLRLLADRLNADGTFGGHVVAEELREAADLLIAFEADALALISTVVVEFGREFDDPLPADDVIPWTWERTTMFGDCPATGTINGHPWHRVKRTITYGPWQDAP